MKKVIAVLFACSLLALSASAAAISDFPGFFRSGEKFDAIFVVGDEAPSLDVISATEISTSVAQYNLTPTVGTSRVDSEISNVKDYDAVVIGSPCVMRAAFELMGEPSPCYKDLGGSIGYIMLFEHGNNVQLLITGLDEKDRHAAAKFLAEKSLGSIKTDEYKVPSRSGSTPQFFAQKVNKTEKEENAEDEPEKEEEEPEDREKAVKIPEPREPQEYGEYDALDEVPEKEKNGFFGKFWDWLAGLFG